MQIKLTPTDIETIIREADQAARHLRRRLQLPHCDQEDLGQDLLVDLLRRLPAFDPTRGSIGAFAGLVLRNQASRIAIRHHRQRRAQGGTLLCLDAPRDGICEPLTDTLSEADSLAAWHGQNTSAIDHADTHNALQAALSKLHPDERQFCAALAHRPVSALVTAGFGSRSALYRRLAELRHVLTAYGLGPAWDDLAAA